MTKQIQNLFVPISKEVLNKITREVKETIATEIVVSHKKVFSTADLWNVQRNKRKLAIRKFMI